MEKLPDAQKYSKPIAEQTLAELFVRPFDAVTIQRPLHHFDKAFGLVPGISATPDREVLTRILTSYRSHQAGLRQELGDGLYRNFVNLVRGKNRATTETLELLSKQFGLSLDELIGMKHGRKDGPLLPQLLDGQLLVVGVFASTFGMLTRGTITCPCCGNNILDDVQAFWERQTDILLSPPEYRFVERCLSTLTGWRVLRAFLADKRVAADGLLSAVSPDPLDASQYPVGNWLEAVRSEFRCKDNLELEQHLAALSTSISPAVQITQPRLNKWACGEDLIPLGMGESIVRSLPNAGALKHALIEARGIAFIHEFVNAAALGVDAPQTARVRLLVQQRVKQLFEKIRLNMRYTLAQQKKLPAPGHASS